MKPTTTTTPAIPSTLRPANGGATLFGHPRFSLRSAASKNQFSVRTACVTSLRPLLLLLLLTLPAVVQAQFTYTTNNGQITITGCTGSGGAVTIPGTIDGLPVTSIGAYAFVNWTSLTSVTIPNNVTSIEGYVFHGCTSLSAITVEALNSFYSSVDGVLFNKSQSTLLQYPEGKAGSYTIPNSVTNIGYYAFNGCTSLTSVTIPNSVTSIGELYEAWGKPAPAAEWKQKRAAFQQANKAVEKKGAQPSARTALDVGGRAQRRHRSWHAREAIEVRQLLARSKAPSRPTCRRTPRPGGLPSGLVGREASWSAVPTRRDRFPSQSRVCPRRRIPTGFRPQAQGCRVGEATLGHASSFVTTPTGLRPSSRHEAPQPRWG